MTPIPHHALGIAVAVLLFVTVAGLLLLFATRRRSSMSAVDQLQLMRWGVCGLAGGSAAGWLILFVAALRNGW